MHENKFMEKIRSIFKFEISVDSTDFWGWGNEKTFTLTLWISVVFDLKNFCMTNILVYDLYSAKKINHHKKVKYILMS
jgi:hypothetical protein